MQYGTFCAASVLTGLLLMAEPSRGQGPVPVVIADVAHAAATGERTVLDQGPQGFSRLWKAFTRSACKAQINREPFSAVSLAPADVLLITALTPSKRLTAEESSALRARVEKGATLLLTSNDLSREGIAAWAELAESFGIQSHRSVLRIVGASQDRRWHVSRYSGGALTRWLGQHEDGPLFFHGTSAAPADGAVLVSYDGVALAARAQVGRGAVYVFGSGDMIGNAFAAPEPPENYDRQKQSPLHSRLIEALVHELLGGVSQPR
jgi:hypothetical protein